MDKKQFFESFISPVPDNSGQKLESFEKIQSVFTALRSQLSDTSLRSEFELLEREILSHVWMFEQICNDGLLNGAGNKEMAWPLIVISVWGEILFVNKAYCTLSGLSPAEIQTHSRAGTLYDTVYDWDDIYEASEAVSRLQAGKGYKHLELVMKHSGRKVSWSSYGWIGESLEIRSGREITAENDQKKEGERFYRGGLMNTARLIENLYQVGVHGLCSAEDEQKLIWIQEFLSMFDFLWNHSEFFMEIIDMPTTKEGKIYGFYNTPYAQFLKCSFEEKKKFRDILTLVHGTTILKFLEARQFKNTLSVGEYTFHTYNKSPVAVIRWQYSIYGYEVLSGYNRMFSFGILTRKISRRNIFVRLFQKIFQKTPAST